ncbi:thioredoxin [Halosquirtibacter xylanolyticus]|uniref:thioredoxin n=1 Tax=Halosquirtibacter xylanolyticus TaxID=3374599 RepID=UPI00374960C9|nr:thioredoxin [Prolixibacteraceae bacterium]
MKKLLFIAFIALSSLTASIAGESNVEIEFNEKTQSFDELLKTKLPVVVDFYATWCGPCKRQAPILEKFAEDNKGKVIIVKVDVDKNKATAKRYAVRSIPTLYIFKNGKIAWKGTGVHTEAQISTEIKKLK